ncbi:MAG TPA: Rieske (2Fe-2S) protein [Polyangia bacterium]|jgi:cytochrome b6-f complex iron-sulfur subunit
MSERLAAPPTRRDFLGVAGLTAFFGAIAVAIAGMLRLPKPSVFPVPSQRYKVGPPGDFPMGDVRMPEGRNVFLFHDARGFFAISATCTHLGCIVKNGPAGFACPCHGSRFDPSGAVTGGPAPRPLDWYAVALAPDGQLVIDEAKTVQPGTYLKG